MESGLAYYIRQVFSRLDLVASENDKRVLELARGELVDLVRLAELGIGNHAEQARAFYRKVDGAVTQDMIPQVG